MEPKRSKYDTNPLDEDVVAHADQSRGSAQAVSPTEEMRGVPTGDGIGAANETARQNSESEAPTRRIDNSIATSYPSIFVPPPAKQSMYQAPRVAPTDIYQPPPAPPPNVHQASAVYKPGSNNVSGLGLPEKWAVILPYFPGYIGIVAAIIELFLASRSEARTRFHAAQGLALQLAILLIASFFAFISSISDSRLGSGLFGAASTIFLIVSMIRVWKGKPLAIPPLDEPRKWLEEKIKPRK